MTSGSEPAVRFASGYEFRLDEFQLDALCGIDRGDHVIVAAPTGSGKTVIAEYAVARALADGDRAFYTTPIKALSNQKYLDLCALHGSAQVGLLTGDNSVNDGAPIVVMTTEVLRNMIYARTNLGRLRYVVLDEVHFLQDAYRGPVWEEVIIHLPPHIQLVCLSATVSNAAELGDWMRSVRGPTSVVVHEVRPVELIPWWMAYDRERSELHEFPVFVGERANRAASEFDAEGQRAEPRPGFRRRRTRALAVPSRQDVVERLQLDDRLPAIYFIFSRAGCDDAVRACLRAGVRLTTPQERADVRELVNTRLSGISPDDRRILGEREFLAALDAGIAAHHAGMVPAFKEAVEVAFVRGLIKVVFATETLAVGINMPARSVVIEKLSKFGGDGHQLLTPGEFTQLTGRAGRRGIDPVGHAITLWSPFVRFDQVAQLAGSRSFELRSAFRPTYNMAVNLVRRYTREQADTVLSKSFAQFRLDLELERINQRADHLRAELSAAKSAAKCERGDTREYAELVAAARRNDRRSDEASEIAAVFERLRPGDVIDAGGAFQLVLSTSGRRGRDVTLRVLNAAGRVESVTPTDLDRSPQPVAHVALPAPFNPSSASFREAATSALRKAVARVQRRSPGGEPRVVSKGRPGRSTWGTAVAAHPVDNCDDADLHVRAIGSVERLQRDLERTMARRNERATSLTDQLERVIALLGERGFVERDQWQMTDKGRVLAGLYHECDLLISECLIEGVFDGLRPPQLAAMASVMIYERRGPTRPGRDGRDGIDGAELPAEFPGQLRTRWSTTVRLARRLQQDEARARLPATRLPDPGFAGVAQRWAGGQALDRVLDLDVELTGGDFVRTTRQLIDLLRQLALVSPNPVTASNARRAAEALLRGVVAATNVVPDDELDDELDDEYDDEQIDEQIGEQIDEQIDELNDEELVDELSDEKLVGGPDVEPGENLDADSSW